MWVAECRWFPMLCCMVCLLLAHFSKHFQNVQTVYHTLLNSYPSRGHVSVFESACFIILKRYALMRRSGLAYACLVSLRCRCFFHLVPVLSAIVLTVEIGIRWEIRHCRLEVLKNMNWSVYQCRKVWIVHMYDMNDLCIIFHNSWLSIRLTWMI